MHSKTLQKWQHSHDFINHDAKGETRTLQVLLLTAVTMLIEIIAGYRYGSMALLADGWHMGTHVAAFGITLFAYRYARRYTDQDKFSFGTGKANALGGFASAIALAVVALMIGLESIQRLFFPNEIQFNEAILVAILGLLVNLISAWLLHDDDHDHHDHNLKAAYFHVLADALTSVLAIIALFLGKYAGMNWLDAAIGLVGMLIITRWAYSLLRQTSSILLDESVEQTKQAIQQTIEADSDNRIADLHVWRISAENQAAIISLITDNPKPTHYYKNLLRNFHLSHISIEVITCEEQCQNS